MDALLPGNKLCTISSELEREQWLTSGTSQFNHRTEESFLTTRTQTLYHPASGTDMIPTMLPRLQKYNYRTGHKGPALDALPLEKRPSTYFTGAGWTPGPACTHAQNLMPTAGFYLQTIKPTTSGYTDGGLLHPNLRTWLILHCGRYNPGKERGYSLNGRLDGPQVLS